MPVSVDLPLNRKRDAPTHWPQGLRRSQKNTVAIGSGEDTVEGLMWPLSVGGLGNCTDAVDCKLGNWVAH